MRNLLIGLVGLAALSLVAAVPAALRPEPVLPVLAPPAAPPDVPAAILAPAPAPATEPVDDDVTRGSDDPWYPELRQLAEQLSDAYLDKPHARVGGGMTEGEKPLGRRMRLDGFTSDVLAAVRARAGELAQFGPDAAWGYAATMMWLGHRETRLASDPSKLGNQDNGRAHGYLQVWEWHGQDPYAMSTALDMLIVEPEHSWSVPKGHPWIGYPECARWVAAHPAPGTSGPLVQE